MAQDAPGAERGRHPAPVTADLGAADRVDAGPDRVKTARANAMHDRLTRPTELQELLARDDAVLPPNQFPRSLSVRCPYRGTKRTTKRSSPPYRGSTSKRIAKKSSIVGWSPPAGSEGSSSESEYSSSIRARTALPRSRTKGPPGQSWVPFERWLKRYSVG